MLSIEYLTVYGGVALAVVATHVWLRRRKLTSHADTYAVSKEAGLNEPVSMHPQVDPNRCFGSGACVKACPEGALGIVEGKATLINASACIGHGACISACPSQALKLVYGTATRGMDVPVLSPQFETNVPGIFIAGELGGMGLIRKATEQGRQAMRAVQAKVAQTSAPAPLDVVILGAGPAGLSAGLSAVAMKLRYAIVEQEPALGGTVYHYPRNKIAMTLPVKLDVVGEMDLGREVPKERLLSFWKMAVDKAGLTFQFGEKLQAIEAQADGSFIVHTSQKDYHTKTVLLALGRRGSPRKLGVPGEAQAKVVYRLVDAAQYRGQQVLVVGGGDSAVEAVLACAAEPGTVVTLSYRGQALSRVKPLNRQRLVEAEARGQVQVLWSSHVQRIDADAVLLTTPQGEQTLPNQAVIVCAGGELPTQLLQGAGIQFDTKFGTA